MEDLKTGKVVAPISFLGIWPARLAGEAILLFRLTLGFKGQNGLSFLSKFTIVFPLVVAWPCTQALLILLLEVLVCKNTLCGISVNVSSIHYDIAHGQVAGWCKNLLMAE